MTDASGDAGTREPEPPRAEEGAAGAEEVPPEVDEAGGGKPEGAAPERAEPSPESEGAVAEGDAPEGAVPPPAPDLPADGGADWRRRFLLTGLVVGTLAALWLLFTWLRWPDVAALADENPRTTAFIERYREAQREQGRPDQVSWEPVPWDRISPNLKRAVVASEDTEFFFHDGFSRHEMKEALKKAIREGEAPRGASTITQQVAKNLWLTPRRSLTRKLREAMLTRQLEKHLPKRRILELYLNIVEFGPGIYGAEAAAQHYFGISAAGLSPRQGAMLAAGLPRPKTWNPSSDSEYYRARVDRILEIEDRLDYLDRYVGARAPGAVRVRPPDVASPTP